MHEQCYCTTLMQLHTVDYYMFSWTKRQILKNQSTVGEVTSEIISFIPVRVYKYQMQKKIAHRTCQH